MWFSLGDYAGGNDEIVPDGFTPKPTLPSWHDAQLVDGLSV
jgi:hypothetical protein